MKIETAKQRAALSSRREPYFASLGKGRALGFRKLDNGGTWIARAYDAGTRAKSYRALGDFADVSPGDQFTAASKAANDWFAHLDKGGTSETFTVADACARYVEDIRSKKGSVPAEETKARFARIITGDPIAGIELSKLKPLHVGDWMKRLQARPAMPQKRGPNCRSKTPPVLRERSAATNERDATALRRALNLALEDGLVTSNAAWIKKLKAQQNTANRRRLYLSLAQRSALVQACPTYFRPFVRAMCLLPIRPGALAKLRVRDFDPRTGSIFIESDKAGGGRAVSLPPTALALFAEQSKGKTPLAPLFARTDGGSLNKDSWKGPVKDAVKLAKLPEATTIYTLRHATISDLVAEGLEIYAVATMAGTSVAMIEKHYGFMRVANAHRALERIAI